MVRTLLRWPGSKRMAIDTVLPLIPEGETIYSPFLGGGSVEIALARRGNDVVASDVSYDLINFWNHVLRHPKDLSEVIQKHLPMDKGMFKNMKAIYKHLLPIEKAAVFYTINKTSMWGMMSNYGEGHSFNQNAVDFIRDFHCDGLSVNRGVYQPIVGIQAEFLYLDPPYYGSIMDDKRVYRELNGDTRQEFDHVELAIMLERRDRFVLHYNDVPAIRDLYTGKRIVPAAWQHFMGKRKRSTPEVLIIG